MPLELLSSHAMLADEKKAHQCGYADYLSKSLDKDLLFAKLKHFLDEEPII